MYAKKGEASTRLGFADRILCHPNIQKMADRTCSFGMMFVEYSTRSSLALIGRAATPATNAIVVVVVVRRR
jgi:hypothetical protein